MQQRYVVVDSDGHTSWDPKDDEAEAFGSLDKAVERAKALASLAPGRAITVYAAHCVVKAEVEVPSVRPW